MTKLIETPYGRKTPELLCQAMDALVREPQLVAFLKKVAGLSPITTCVCAKAFAEEAQELLNELETHP